MLAIIPGCTSVGFVQTDPAFHPVRSERAPKLFVEAPPDRPYRSVGIIEVRGSVSHDETLERARAKGRELGCEILVARSLTEQSAGATTPPVLLAHGGPSVPKAGAPKRDAHDRQFLCAHYKQAPRQDTSPTRA